MFRFISLFLLGLSFCLNSTVLHAAPLKNQLKDNPSPYLALHQNDPTAWQEWGEAVLKKAQKENKLILLSSGYFSCHWCHVMQRESYQNEEIAKLLNEYFIPVKIDRELEPALDARLMDYAQSTLKRGGWPLNVFVSPDGIEVFALLYQPQPQFKQLLEKLVEVWEVQSKRISKLAQEERVLDRFPDAEPKLDASLVGQTVSAMVNQILSRADEFEGGFKGTNKFPSSPQLSFLLHQYQRAPSDVLKEVLETTLDAMAYNGLVDHLEGGFFRYSVDPSWAVPHFEKMLYNNANLARLYLAAAEALQRPSYAQVAKQTLDFMLTVMRDENEKAFYASFSAVDNHEVEGGYYLWEPEQIKAILSEREYAVFNAFWSIERPNDLEAGNHLRSPKPTSAVVKELGLSDEIVGTQIETARLKLVAARKQRELPVDDKLLAGWNSFALTTLIEAAEKWDDPRYRNAAKELQHFIVTRLWNGERLARGFAGGKVTGRASLEDYAYFAEAQWHWAKLTGEKRDIALLESVIKTAWKRFYINNAWLNADESLLPPKSGVEIGQDGALPAPAPILIRATLGYAEMAADSEWRDKALSALNRGHQAFSQSAYWYATHGDVMAGAIAP